ncbi:MAG: hypothetical protein V4662_13890 [Verrucomicrobiota bacterium]
MKTHASSVIEALETKVAPAGTVAAVFAGGVLTLTGDLDANLVTLTETTPDMFTLVGVSGTLVQFNGGTVSGTVIFTEAVHTIKVDLKEGGDTFTLVNADLTKDLTINQGIGDNTTSLNNVLIGGNVLVQGGSGADTVNLNTNFYSQGNVTFNLGDGANSVLETAGIITIQGMLSYTGGNASDIVNLGVTSFLSVGSIKAATGGGGGGFILQSQGALSVGGAVNVTTLDHAGVLFTMTLSAEQNAFFGGPITVKHGVGSSTVTLIGTDSLQILGSVSVTNGHSTGTSGVSIISSAITIEGGLTIKNGNGVFTNIINSPTGHLEVTGAISITNGNTGGNSVNQISAKSLDIGGGITFVNGNGSFINSMISPSANVGGAISFTTRDSLAGSTQNTINCTTLNSLGIAILNGDGRFTNTLASSGGRIAGNIAITQGDASERIDTAISVPLVTGNLTLKNGNGDFKTEVTGASLMLGGSLSIKNGIASANCTTTIAVPLLNIDGGVSFSQQQGSTFFTINGTNADIKGALTIANGNTASSSNVFINATEALRIGGGLGIKNGSGIHTTVLLGTLIQIGGSVTAQYGSQSTGTSSLEIGSPSCLDLRIGGGLTFKTLGGATKTKLEALSTTIGGAVSISTGDSSGDLFDSTNIFGGASLVCGSITVSNGSGLSSIIVNSNNSLLVKGSISFSSLAGDDGWSVAGPGRITGSIIANPGAGATGNLIMVNSFSSLEVGGSLTTNYSAVTGNINITLTRVIFLGGITHTGGTGVDTLSFTNSQVRGNTSLSTGTGADVVTTSLSHFFGNFATQMGAGSDVMNINDSQFRGTFTANMGTESDIINLEADGAQTGRSIFFKATSFLLGDGDDTAFIGGSAAARLPEFKVGATVDGGAGNDGAPIGSQVIGAVTLVSVP